MALTMEQLNSASREAAAQMLDGLYEHSPWIAEQALNERPFTSLAHLKHAMCEVLSHAGREAQLGLIRAHPELAGKAMVSKTLTAESTNEQTKAGLTDCTPEEFAQIQQLNADYNAKFGWPFILAVRGPRGMGLHKRQIIDAFERRLHGHPDFELAECLRNIHRIVEIRLNDKFGVTPTEGNLVWDWAETLAQHTEADTPGVLTVTYGTQAHQACARWLQDTMLACGFDQVHIDAVGNVVGLYLGTDPSAPRLLTGSHYDTVRNGGKYDGRLGIFVPMACVQRLRQQGQRLPYTLEVVGFAEEEGQRYKATFLGSGALVGQFDPAWLDQTDAQGIRLTVDINGQTHILVGEGNGPIHAAVHAFESAGIAIEVRSYEERSMTGNRVDGSAPACAIIEAAVNGKEHFGVGIDGHIVTASLKALVSSLNRAGAVPMRNAA